MRSPAALDITVLGLDPSTDPGRYGWAAVRNGRLLQVGNMLADETAGVSYGNRLAEISATCREIMAEPWYRESAGGIFYLAIDYVLMFTYKTIKDGHGRQVNREDKVNLNSLARNHQAIGATLATFNIPDKQTILYFSHRHKDIDKRVNWDEVIRRYKLDPSKVDEHIADAIKIAVDSWNTARLSPDLLDTMAKLKSLKSTKELL